MYSSILSLNSTLDSGGWLTPRPGRFTPVTRYVLYRRMGRTQGPSRRLRKTWVSPGLDPATVQPTASRYKYSSTQA
jgi:hypothetical protein